MKIHIRKSDIDREFCKKGEWYILAPSIKSFRIMQSFAEENFYPEPLEQKNSWKGSWKCVHDVAVMYNGKSLDALVFEWVQP